jgi:hypothetical protein
VLKVDDPVLLEIATMSFATCNRYLTEERGKMEPLSRSTTKKPTCSLRSEISFGKSWAQTDRPDYLSTDTVAHCGANLKGEHSGR